ncbi:MAG: hypothetical protein Q8M19_01975 [Reyranella sp.]|nr:hypothetical protein [Reyranella sp.]
MAKGYHRLRPSRHHPRLRGKKRQHAAAGCAPQPAELVTGHGSAFTFRLDRNPEIYVAAAAHEVYDRGSWTLGKDSDGTPDRENLYIHSNICNAGEALSQMNRIANTFCTADQVRESQSSQS